MCMRCVCGPLTLHARVRGALARADTAGPRPGLSSTGLWIEKDPTMIETYSAAGADTAQNLV